MIQPVWTFVWNLPVDDEGCPTADGYGLLFKFIAIDVVRLGTANKFFFG